MRVLHFYKTYYPESVGGVERVIFELATHLPDHGVEVDVLSLAPQRMDRQIQLARHTAYKAREDLRIASTGFSLSVIHRFKELAKKADVIHYHFPWPFMDLVHILSGVDKPTVVTYHSDIIRQKRLLRIYRPLMYWFMSKVSRVVATSPNYLFTSKVLQKYRDKVEVIPLGVDKAGYPLATDGRKKHWKNIVGEKFFLFVGVLRYYKGLDTLLDALSVCEFPVVIVGAGPVEQELKAKASALGLKSLIFVGQIFDEDKVALLELSYAIVFPSNLRSEAFGISLLEGAMYGKPLISCEIGTGTSFVNEHGVTGLVVMPGDKTSLSDAMSKLWNNPELAQQMGQAAEARYQQFFTADQMASSYADLYTRLLAEHSERPRHA